MSLPILPGGPDWPSLLLSRAGAVDPEAGIEAAESSGAWAAYRTVVADLSPEAVIALGMALVGAVGVFLPDSRPA